MWRLVLLFILFLPTVAQAYAPVFVHPVSSDDVIRVPSDGQLHTYYGTLENFPHTYELTVAQSTALKVQLLVPNDPAVPHNRNGIIVKNETRGVGLVARFDHETAPWTVLYDTGTQDTYRRGGSYTGTITSGTYKIEVSTGDNQGPYVLQVGAGVPGTDTYPQPVRSYWQRLVDTYQVKRFLHDPWWSFITVPVYALPLVLVLLCGLGGVYYYRRKYHA